MVHSLVKALDGFGDFADVCLHSLFFSKLIGMVIIGLS